ncbi:hypothetical protein BC829DRAFT_283628 [Chytridium lagenaria]|nr:hypothetical protein BC829DRAFT_283628 [Chytridium lagenaria]
MTSTPTCADLADSSTSKGLAPDSFPNTSFSSKPNEISTLINSVGADQVSPCSSGANDTPSFARSPSAAPEPSSSSTEAAPETGSSVASKNESSCPSPIETATPSISSPLPPKIFLPSGDGGVDPNKVFLLVSPSTASPKSTHRLFITGLEEGDGDPGASGGRSPSSPKPVENPSSSSRTGTGVDTSNPSPSSSSVFLPSRRPSLLFAFPRCRSKNVRYGLKHIIVISVLRHDRNHIIRVHIAKSFNLNLTLCFPPPSSSPPLNHRPPPQYPRHQLQPLSQPPQLAPPRQAPAKPPTSLKRKPNVSTSTVFDK